MRLQVLASGSKGNSTLVRAGECCVLIDAGLTRTKMEARLEAAKVGVGGLDHILVSHGHLDHSRSAGILARSHDAPLHCSGAIQSHAALRRSKRTTTLSTARPAELRDARDDKQLEAEVVIVPHDAEPTFAFRLRSTAGATAVILTDMGRPVPAVAQALGGAQVLVLESNYDPGMLRAGPYPAALQRRIAQGRGHLSNAQSAEMLRLLAGPELHTVVLAHLSEKNNAPELALAEARAALDGLGLAHVRLLAARQDEPLEELHVG